MRIFQDALRVIFEEILEVELPDDFHFLRIPGEDFVYQTQNVKQEFLGSRPHLGEELYPYEAVAKPLLRRGFVKT